MPPRPNQCSLLHLRKQQSLAVPTRRLAATIAKHAPLAARQAQQFQRYTMAKLERNMPMLCRWGNSLGLRIPRYVADCAHLQAGDVLKIRLLDSGEILVSPVSPVPVSKGPAPDCSESKQTSTETLSQW